MIFRKAQNRIQDPAKLQAADRRPDRQGNWSAQGVDVKGDAYEELLAKSAEDIKTGAGQYFTPAGADRRHGRLHPAGARRHGRRPGVRHWRLPARRVRIHPASVRQRPDPGPARSAARRETITGTELVDGTARLAAMNMLVHGIGKPNGPSLIEVRDSLAEPPRRYPSVVLANPPFGKKSSITVIGENGSKERDDISYARPDFWVTTANKQLNFVQHITTMLGIPGRAAVVVPDNVLFEGGAGETVRRRLLRQFDVHTLLRLPTGIFYAGGVKANVLFFDKKPARPDQPWTTTLWVYDFRGDQHFTLKQNRMQRQHLDDFVACYRPGEPRENREPTERFRSVHLRGADSARQGKPRHHPGTRPKPR